MASWRRARRRKIRGLPAGAWSLKPDPFVATGAEQLSQVLCGDEANTTIDGVKVTGAHTTLLPPRSFAEMWNARSLLAAEVRPRAPPRERRWRCHLQPVAGTSHPGDER